MEQRSDSVEKLAAFLAAAQDNPHLQEHIHSSDREELLRDLYMWHGLTPKDIEASLGWLRKGDIPTGLWVWW